MRRTVAALVVLVALVAGACTTSDQTAGSGGSTATTAVGPADAEALRESAREVTEAIFAGNGPAAWHFLTDECQEKVDRVEWQVQITMSSAVFEGFTGVSLKDLVVVHVDVRDVTDGSGEARPLVRTADGSEIDGLGDEYSTWVVEDGRWRLPECTTLGEDLGGGASPTTMPVDGPGSPTDPLSLGEAAVVGGWEVVVHDYIADATTIVVESSLFNPPPQEGEVFSLLIVEATNLGPVEGSASVDLGFGYVAADSSVHESYECLAIEPIPLSMEPAAPPGGTVVGQVCLEMPASAAGTGEVYVEAYGERVWWMG